MLGTWIVEVVGRARIERYVDPAALRVAARDQIGAALWRNFLVGAAVHHLDRRIRPVAGIETALERTRRIERESGPKPHAVEPRCIGRHGGEGRASTIGPALKTDPIWRDVRTRPQIRECPVGIERTHCHFVERGRPRLITEAREALWIAAWAETIDQQRHIAVRGPDSPHALCRCDRVAAS